MNLKSLIGNENDFTQDSGKRFTKIFGTLFIILLFVVFVFVFVYQRMLLNNQRENLIKTITNTLLSGIEKVSFSGKYHSKQFIENMVDNNENIVYIILQDLDKNIFTSSDLSNIKCSVQKDEDAIFEAVSLSNHQIKLREMECIVNGKTIKLNESMITYVSGYGGTSKKYIMRVGISVQEIEKAFLKGIIYLAILFIFIAATGILAVLFISGYFATPIKKLAFELKGILEKAPFALYFMYKNGELEKYSNSFKKEFIDQESNNFYKILKISEIDRFKKEDEELFNGKEIEAVEYSYLSKDRQKYYIFIRFPVLVNPKTNKIELIGGIAVDITVRKEIEKQLKESQEELQELNKNLEIRVAEEVRKNREKDEMMIRQARLAAMGEMISNIAHQWRQPLTTLSGIIMNLEDSFETKELTQEEFTVFIKKANEVITFLSKTIDDFRNFFRPNKQIEHFNIKDTINSVYRIIEATFKNSGIAVNFEVLEDISIDGYSNEYAHVVLNILNNARDVLLERKIKNPWVKITLLKEDDKSVLIIRDNAGGIAPEIMDKIFEPYFSTKSSLNGTGIGLYTAKMIIEKNMHGRIIAQNTEDGAEFRIIV